MYWHLNSIFWIGDRNGNKNVDEENSFRLVVDARGSRSEAEDRRDRAERLLANQPEICIPHDRHVQRVSMASEADAWMAMGALCFSSAGQKRQARKSARWKRSFPADNNREPNKNK
jgi:hypothetical protein